MWFGVLGRLESRDEGERAVRVGGSVRRQLLAALLCRSGDLVTAGTLIEDLWGAVPPRTAAKTLQSHVVRLRDDLGRDGGDVIVTDGNGYRVDLSVAELDATSFENGLKAGLAAVRSGHDLTAVESFDAALALWRGDAYLDFPEAPFTLGERIRLAGLRAVALEARTDVQLRLGAAATLVPELGQRARREPYRERSWEQLILALYRSGRQAEALATYRLARDLLAADLGVDPGPALRTLEEQVLRQDPALLSDGWPAATTAPGAPSPTVRDQCPYRGLDGYGTDDAAVFVGRERLTGVLVGRLAEPGVVVITGASGSGKSSLVRAGVIPSLRAGALPGSARWRATVALPGERLSTSGNPDVIVIDQAEELFTLLDPRARGEAVEHMRSFVDRGGRLVLVLRGDFFANLADLPWLAGYAQQSPLLVGPMREDELARAVVEPARRAGIDVSREVVDAVLADAAGQAQPLPLISLSLVRAWEHRHGDAIGLASYEAGGRVAGALQATAEAAYAGMSDELKAAARRMLLRMAVREGVTWVRRPLPRDSVPDADSAAAIEVLADARLVTMTAARVELSHDALLQHWSRLRDWLGERVAAADLLEHLAETTRAWVADGRPESDLHRGPRLQAALDWRREHPNDLAPDEDEFLDASAAAADAELRAAEARAATQARGRRRLRWVVAALAAALALFVAGALVAVHLRSVADRSAARARLAALSADARRLAASSLASSDLATSAILAVAGYRLGDSSDTRGALLSALVRSQSTLYRIGTPRRDFTMVGTSDGARLYAVDDGGIVQVIDTARRAIVAHYAPNANTLVGVAPGGADLVLYGDSSIQDHGQLSVVDAATGRPGPVLDATGPLGFAEPAMAPEGRWVLTEETARPPLPGRTLAVYDADDWSRPGRTMQMPSDIIALAAARDLLAAETANRTLYLIDPASMRIVAEAHRSDLPSETQANTGLPFVLSPDGRELAFASSGSTIWLLDTAHPHGAARRLPDQGTTVTGLNFSDDGSRLAIGAAGGSVNVYDTLDASLTAALAGHSGDVNGVVWTRSGGLFTAGLDKQVIAWNLARTSRLVTEHGGSVPAGDVADHVGDHIIGTAPHLQGDVPGTAARLFDFDLATRSYRSWPLHLSPPDFPTAISATPDGSRALISVLRQGTELENRWQLWDLNRGALLASVSPLSNTDESDVRLAAITPDGHSAVTALDNTTLGVLSLPSGRLIRSLDIEFPPPKNDHLVVEPWGFTPEGALLITAADKDPNPEAPAANDRIGLVDVDTGQLTAQYGLGAAETTAAGWSHDKRRLLIGTTSGTVDVFTADTLRLVSAAADAQTGWVLAVSFSPDGRTIVSSGTDATMNLWDTATMTREGPRITVPGAGSWWWAWYAPDGSISGLAPDASHPTQDRERVFTFPSGIGQWVQQACALAGSDISRAQWARYVGSSQPYRHVCSR